MATPKWNKQRKLWIIQGQKNGIKKSLYSSTPGTKGKREVIDLYDDWIEFGGVQKITVEKCVELYLRDIEARLGRRDTYRETEIYTRLYVLPTLGRCKMNNLSLRLKEIANYIPDNIKMVDIGCDHALLDIYLCNEFDNIKTKEWLFLNA